MRLLGLVIALSSMFCMNSAYASTWLKVASFNIEWFGLGGDMDGTSADEYRDNHLAEFIEENLSDRDLIVFQEIVDPDRLAAAVMGDQWQCVSYLHTYEKHQHVMLCAKNKFRILRSTNDTNFKLESVAINSRKSRPALNLIIADDRYQPLLQVFGVHLKAYPQESETRVGQTEAIAEYMMDMDRNTPFIVIGDFNSYDSPANEQEIDDKELFRRVFDRAMLPVRYVYLGDKVTYAKGDYAWQLDQIYYSEGIRTASRAEVLGACNSGSSSYIRWYNRYISDHCPVTVTLKIPDFPN